ncbi:quinolinate synthase [Marinicella pacifica]|uniref:Quinolinate synthase n=1 Tax=Marinicella pacifica TaxID=1171543 RepID=A0A917FNY8_9GAMM|nr:quinolinate synthase NadA [Marinicella pacifica]GGF95035.1 quinolinate synthase [Marinicella pacifica]
MLANPILDKLTQKLSDQYSEAELILKAEMAQQIIDLKQQKNALILGHNYMEPALFHTVPDFTGDSLELSRKAAETDKDIIVFCGVEFMAETAKILSPDKMVLVPSSQAGCSLAESITAADVRKLKEQFPGVPVVTYINTYADVKAETDICCTSGNAKQVVESLNSDTVIFLPDEYLAGNIARETGKHIIFPSKTKGTDKDVDVQLIGWHGRCEVHDQFTVEDIEHVRATYPDAKVLAHPECKPEVVDAADFSGSTTAMINYIRDNHLPRYLLLTECAMGDNIHAENPNREMLRMCHVRCPHMNQIQLKDTYNALLFNQYQIIMDEDIRQRAYQAVNRMLQIG